MKDKVIRIGQASHVLQSELQRWLDALRSGKYTQGNGSLYNADSEAYCCLGVACNVFIPHVDVSCLPFPSMVSSSPSWLKDINTSVFAKTSNSLSDMNDKLRYTFDEIADVIENLYLKDVA